MAGSVLTVTDAQFKAEVLDSPLPVLVDFWATWCAPCKAIAPTVEELAGKYAGKMKVAKLDVDSNQETAQKYNIRSIPTLLVFKGGQVVEQIVGAVAKAKLDDTMKKFA